MNPASLQRIPLAISRLLGAILVVLFFVASSVAQTERLTLQWIVKDTAVSTAFLRGYIEAKEKLSRAKNSGEEEIENVQTDDGVVVQFDLRRKIPSGVKTLSPEGVVTALDPMAILQVDRNVTKKLLTRQYHWEEYGNVEKAETYVGNVVSLFMPRNTRPCKDAFWWSPFNTVAALPSRFSSMLSDDISFEAGIGLEEFGYLWGTAGVAKVGLANRFAKLYMTIPINGISKKSLIGASGVGFQVDGDRYGGGVVLEGAKPDSGQVGLQGAAFLFYSNAIDFSRAINKATLRWKIGPALAVYRDGDIKLKTDNWESLVTSVTSVSLYARLELVTGEIEDLRLSRWEFAFQGFVGSKKRLMLSTTYNVSDWLGFEFDVASILPADKAQSDLTILFQPKIRL